MKIEKEIQESVIDDYKNSDLKIKEIAEKHGLCRQSIRNIIIKNGEALREKKISEEIEKKIIKEYLEGTTNKELSIKHNLHRTTVQRVLLRNKINLKPQELTSRKKHLIIDFKDIDTPNKAYILGILYADGNIFKSNVEICLKYTDKQILEDISKFVYGKVYLRYREGRVAEKRISSPQYRFSITSKEEVKNLKRHGLIENKSLKITLPEIEENLFSHFVRGYFDGDGCLFVSKHKKYKGNSRVIVVSNYIFCEQLKDKITEKLEINARVNKKTDKVGCVSISGNKQIKKFLDWMYQGAELKLDRKYNLYLKNYK